MRSKESTSMPSATATSSAAGVAPILRIHCIAESDKTVSSQFTEEVQRLLLTNGAVHVVKREQVFNDFSDSPPVLYVIPRCAADSIQPVVHAGIHVQQRHFLHEIARYRVLRCRNRI